MCKPGSKWTVGVELCVCHEPGPRKQLDMLTFPEIHNRYIEIVAQTFDSSEIFNA